MSSSNGLVWEEPPTTKGPAGRGWVGIFEQLRKRPDEWALVYTQVEGEKPGHARNHRNHIQGVAVRRGVPIEVVSRTVDGSVKVYARVVSS